VFNEFTTGASNDIERATNIARKMVCEFGMSEKLGPVTYGNKQEEVFLGKELYEHKNYSEETQILIDDEIKKIVQAGMDRAERILNENTDKLHRLAEVLLDREILDSEEIDKVLKGEVLPPIVDKSINNNVHDIEEKIEPVKEDNIIPEQDKAEISN
jgi:cell division protease FtsH